jgi:hypothetical protein
LVDIEKIQENYVSISKVCLLLEISPHTIKRWYKFWENDSFSKPDDLYLPPYYYVDRRKTKYFKKEDIPKLVAFHEALQTTHRGCMSEYNAAYQWKTDVGTRALKNKNLDIEKVKRGLR